MMALTQLKREDSICWPAVWAGQGAGLKVRHMFSIAYHITYKQTLVRGHQTALLCVNQPAYRGLHHDGAIAFYVCKIHIPWTVALPRIHNYTGV